MEEEGKNLEERGKLQKVSILKIWEKEVLLYFYRALSSKHMGYKRILVQTNSLEIDNADNCRLSLLLCDELLTF